MILVIWWKFMSKEREYCLNLGKCWYQASHYETELWLLCSCSICNWGLLSPKYTVLLSALQRNVLTALYRQQWTQGSRRKGDQNPNSKVAATMKLLDNSSYGYQIMDRSRHTVTKYLSDEKTHAARSCEQFIVWSWTRQSIDWTKRTNHCRFLHSPIRKTANAGAVLRFLHQVLWCNQVRRFRNGHRFVVSCYCRERSARLYQTWNKSGMAEVAIKWLCRFFHLLML